MSPIKPPQIEDKARTREREEPAELHNPVPWPLLAFFVGVIGWGGYYYFSDLLSATGAGAEAGDRRSVVVIDPSAKVDGAAVFSGNCAACHQAGGTGVAGVFPPLAGSEWVVATKDIPIQILLHGLSGPMTVAGQPYAGAMPAFGRLTDPELAAVISHLRKSWGNAAGEVSAADIATGRKRFPDRSTPWSEAELKAEVGSP